MNGTIVITGLLGAGNTTTARKLAEQLSLSYFSAGQLFKDIANGSVKEKNYYGLFKALCGKRNLEIPHFQNKDDSHGAVKLWNTAFGRSKELHNAIDELQVKLAEKGKIVLDAKLGIYQITNADCKIWLTSSLEARANRTADRDKIPFADALSLIKLRDEKQKNEWGKIYGIDYTEQEKSADLVIDTTSLSPGSVVEKIIAFMRNGKL